ncbi:uncharacterized protein LOC134706077 [Mytilus trossulus]|uniref:uncharacterized protein LOC134706077 n=1 Tax=Mytilus trossulus TaxID=6551 RepID=UPI003006CB04
MEKGELDNTELIISINDDFKNMLSIVDICNIESQKTKLHINHFSFGQSAKIPTLIEKQFTPNIDNIQIQKKYKMKFPDTCYATGCTSLRNDSMLFVDQSSKRIILFDSNSRFLRNIEVGSKPFDIVSKDDFVVAVTLFEANKILFIELSSDQDKVIKEIDVIGQCFGIDYSDHRLAVSVEGYGIQIFDDTGIKIKTIPYASRCVSFANSHICYIDYQSSVLKCTNYNGQHIWEITLPKALNISHMAITVDQNGNVYVLDSYGDKLYIVSSDGTRYKRLLQKSDELSNPKGIYFNTRKQQLLMITIPSNTAVLYDVV